MPTKKNAVTITRRAALGTLGACLAGCALPSDGGSKPATGTAPRRNPQPAGPLPISLAEWSLHKPLFENEITNLDFPREAKTLGFAGVEYVNQFFKDKALDKAYLKQLIGRCDDAGVRSLLIMVDGEGALGAPDAGARADAVENHVKWLDAAARLGCHSIRVNASSEGPWDEQQKLAADGLRALCEKAEGFGLNVIVENHGGPTSNGEWLAATIRRVNHPLCGTLPDFGNFCYDWGKADDPTQWYDRYRGVRDLMPLAKAVSAKSYDFDDAGNETTIDYARMMRIVRESGYRGWVGVEYEGQKTPPREGIRLTRALLERVMSSWSA